MRALLPAALQIGIAACGLVGLVAVFDDTRVRGSNALLLSLESHVLPVAVGSGLLLVLLFLDRKDLRARCGRLPTPAWRRSRPPSRLRIRHRDAL